MLAVRKLLLCCLLLTAGALSAHAQTPAPPARGDVPPPTRSEKLPIRFERLNVEDGLSQGTILDMIQDRQGYLWFCTQTGLNRYDGHAFKIYAPIPFDSTSILPDEVVEMHEAQDGTFWLAGRNEGISRFDPATGKAIHYRPDPDDPASLPESIFRDILETRDGVLWVGTDRGLSRMEPDAPGRFTHYLHDPADPHSLSHNDVNRLFEDAAGTLWIGTDNGLNRMDPATPGRFTRYLTGPGGPDEPGSGPGRIIVGLYEDPDAPGVLWMGTNHGLVRLDVATGETARYHPAPARAHVAEVLRVTRDPATPGLLWATVPRLGVVRFDTQTGAFTPYEHDPRDPHSLPAESPVHILTDRAGVIWVGHTVGGGISRFDPASVGFQVYRHDPEDPNSLAGEFVRGLHEDRAGRLWVGTASSGSSLVHVQRMDRTTGEVIGWTANQDNPPPPEDTSSPSAHVWAITEDAQGDIWLGTDQGVDRYDPHTGRFTHYRHDPADATTLSEQFVLALLEGPGHTLWVATIGASDAHGGVDRLDPATGTATRVWSVAHASGTELAGAESLIEDHAGRLWAGLFPGGIVRIDPHTGEGTLYRHDPAAATTLAGGLAIALAERKREPGVLWIGSSTSGLSRLDTRTGTFTHYTTEDGLPDNTIYCLLEDNDGMLWMSTNRGLARFDPGTEQVRTFGLDHGLQGLEFNRRSCTRGRSGELFFGGTRGLNAFFPSQVTINETPPQLALTGFRLFNRPVEPGPDAPLQTALAETNEIRLAHDQNHVDFDYVALHFKNPEENRYAYRLGGFDADWIEAGTDRTATYTNLPPGRYTFRVKAANSDGVWNEEGAAVRLTILPPWWRTWWAYMLYSVPLFALGFGIIWVAQRQAARREREAAREREREQAREIERAYNELRTAKDQLVQQEKMASLGALTAGIAHEIKNPLNFVNNFASLSRELVVELREETDPEEIQAILADLELNAEKIEEHGKRADGIVRSMMQHARGGDGQREAVDLNPFVDEYVDLAYHGKRAQVPDFNTEIVRDYGEGIGNVEIVPQDIGRVLINLLNNAFDAVREHAASMNGQYEPTVRVSTCRKENAVEIRVEDNGPGIPYEAREKIFEPFFTTKPTGTGTGLGLSMSYDIITQGHGGTLTVDSNEEAGATFVVTLPAQSTAKRPDVPS